MSVKNLVYNKLARQNIFFCFINAIQIFVVLTYCYHYLFIIYILILILIIININFIVLLLLLYFIFVTVTIVIVLSSINVIYFNLSHFIPYCSYYYDFSLRVACDVMCPTFLKVFLFPFLFNDFHFILPLLIHVKNHFSLAIIVYTIIAIITTILYFSTLPIIGGKFCN